MPSDCPSCGRSSSVHGAAYCMYCGGRLSQHDPHATISHVGTSEELQDTVPDASPPERIGGYRIVRRLGEGGMGSVYEAEAAETGQRVAVKLLSSKLAANPTSVERFRQEGRLASQIVHPRCVFVYRADADAGRPFIVMELMPGQTLKDVVEQQGPFSPGDAVARILDVIDGLIEAHRLGLIHRDVKPSNCFITADNRVKVGDFGLSKSLVESGADGQLTGTGAFLGTVLYAPPEQIRGEEVGYDSDVYSICATLYFLLTGRAPYQHESMTAALAKAISEPPPSIRRQRPDVPKALERVVNKGLERDRTRRFGTLEELRDAVAQLLPGGQTPARTRMLVAAYCLDLLLTTFIVQMPVELVEWLLGLRHTALGGFQMLVGPMALFGLMLYFAACEGFLGATIGKWLLGLRVVRLGSVGPPGFGLATLRCAAFHAGWFILYAGLIVLAEVPLFGLPLGLLLMLGGIAYLSYRIRRPASNRGLHDWCCGCHIVQAPRRPHRIRLSSHAPNRLDHPSAVAGLPSALGGYSIRGRLTEYSDQAQVWVADDRSLGRRVLIHLKPAKAETPEPPTRPNRLRVLGHGELEWNERTWTWRAFAAPAGAPLADMIDPKKPLNWPDSRLLIEQLVEEMNLSEQDGSMPPKLNLNQLWSEPGGRLFLLEFAAPSSVKMPSVQDSTDLIRQTATLLLEGQARATGGRVKAPLPPLASKITNRLFDPTHTYPDLSSLQRDLGASHAHEPTVTTKMRATQIGMAAILTAFPLILMFGFTQLNGFLAATQSLNLWAVTDSLMGRLERPSIRSALRERPDLKESLADANLPRTMAQMRVLRVSQYEDYERENRSLSRPEQYVTKRYRDFLKEPGVQLGNVTPESTASIVSLAQQGAMQNTNFDWRSAVMSSAAWICGFFLLAFAIFAFLFRGGVSYLLSGIALVRRDGQRCGRFRCAVRELALWLPLVLVLLATGYVQVLWPDWFAGRIIATGCAIGVLVGYAAIGFRTPEQGPHDRLLGTWRVPV